MRYFNGPGQCWLIGRWTTKCLRMTLFVNWAEEKTILLPCVKGDELEIRYFDGRENCVPGEGYAIPEPVGRLFTDLNKIDVFGAGRRF